MVAKSRSLWIRPLVPTALCTSGWFSRRAVSPNFTLTQHFPSCERMQQENRIHTMGSLPPFDRSQHSWVWPLDERQLSRGFLWDRANAEKFRFPPILLKTSRFIHRDFSAKAPYAKKSDEIDREAKWAYTWAAICQLGLTPRHQKLVGLYDEQIRHSEPEPEFFNTIRPSLQKRPIIQFFSSDHSKWIVWMVRPTHH